MRIFIILCTMFFSLLFAPMVLAVDKPPASLQDALAGANAELKATFNLTFDVFRTQNVNKKPINPDRWQEKDRVLFAYGNPYGDNTNGRNRYLGETVKGEDFSNPFFPNDAWSGGHLEDRQWVKNPWLNTTIQNKYNISPNPIFDGNPLYLPSIQRGLEMYYGDVSLGSKSPMWSQWYQYVHVLQPPTQYAYGLGRMWHVDSSGKYWYISIPMVPFADIQPEPQPPAPAPQNPQPVNNQGPTTGGKENLKIYITGHSGDPWPGNTVTVTAQALNESGQYLTTDLVWKLNGQVIKTVNNFDLIKTGSPSVSFKMPSGPAKVDVSINPNKNRPQNETTWADNYGGITINPLQLPPVNNNSLSVKISAPARVEPFTTWGYQVTVTFAWTRPTGYKGAAPTKSVTLTTTGAGKISTKQDVNGMNVISPVSTSHSESFKITGGTSKTFTYTFPSSGLFNEGYYAVLNSKLSTNDSDAAKVYVNPLPVNRPKPVLDQ